MLESRSSYGYYGWRGGASGETKPEELPDWKIRCKDCVCLVGINGEWHCDECDRPCSEIEYDECPEAYDFEDDDDLEMGFDPYLGCYTDDV